MHNSDAAPPPPPPTCGAQLLLELAQLIVHSRQPASDAPAAPPLDGTAVLDGCAAAADSDEGYRRLLATKLLAARSLTPGAPSTSRDTADDVFRRSLKIGLEGARAGGGRVAAVDADAVGAAVAHAQRALYLDAQLNTHVQALWTEQAPICIDVLLAGSCQHCVGGEPLLLERWTLSMLDNKGAERPAFITPQWLLNAVRSQLHFSQISAWRAKLANAGPTDPEERKRRRSRETCNYKKLESNCDEEREDKDARKLNVTYCPCFPRDAHRFVGSPTDHVFPLTDIGVDLFLKVALESLPRQDEIPSVRCLCSANPPPAPKRRLSKDSGPHEELACRMNDLTLGPPADGCQDHYRCKGATFSPDLGIINSNIGCSSGISRKLSIFANNAEYNGSTRVSTPEKQFYNDSGYPDSSAPSPAYRGSPSKDKKNIQLDHPYFNRSLSVRKETIANYLLLDDRMLTPCSENGKHRCSCDDESDQGKEYPRSSTSFSSRDDSGKKVLDERRLKEIAKYKRRLRKESKLKKMRESGTSDSAGTSECADRSPEKEKEEAVQTTSIPILQAARFDRMRTIGCYRNRTYLTLPANCRGEDRAYRDAACDTVDPAQHAPILKKRTTASISTQTDDVACACGQPVDLSCELCRSKMVRSEASFDLAQTNQSEMLLEAMERTGQLRSPVASARVCARRKERDEVCCDDEKVMKKHKCDNNDRNSKCDTFSFSDSLSWQCPGAMKGPDDDVGRRGIIKRPNLRRFLPVTDRIERVVTDRRRQHDDTSNDIDDLLLRGDDSVFAYMAKSHSTPEKQPPRPPTDEEYLLYEAGTFDRFDHPESLVQDDDRSDSSHSSSEFKRSTSALDGSDKRKKVRSGEQPEVPSPSEMEGFRWRLDSAASMVFHARTGLPLTSSPAPLRRGNSCFDYDSSITGISGIKSALFHPVPPSDGWCSPGSSPGSPAPAPASPPPLASLPAAAPPPARASHRPRLKLGPGSGLLGSFEESALQGRLEPAATVHGFTAELGASGEFCPPHRRLPVTVFFYALGGTNAPYLGHINLGPSGYRVPRSGTVQVSLLNPHGTLVKMFVVLYELTDMPPAARTFLRQRTLHVPCDVTRAPPPHECYRWLRYLIHLRFLTSKSGKLYLHTDIRIIVSRKADLDTATAHSPYTSLKLTSSTRAAADTAAAKHATDQKKDKNDNTKRTTDLNAVNLKSAFAVNGEREARPGAVNRVFGGCDDQDVEEKPYDYDSAKSDHDFLIGRKMNRSEACLELSTHCDHKNDAYDVACKVENSQNVSYELRSFTYAPDNPKYSPR